MNQWLKIRKNRKTSSKIGKTSKKNRKMSSKIEKRVIKISKYKKVLLHTYIIKCMYILNLNIN